MRQGVWSGQFVRESVKLQPDLGAHVRCGVVKVAAVLRVQPTGDASVIVVVDPQKLGQVDLFEISRAFDARSPRLGFGQSRQYQRRQDCDNGDHHQELDEGESPIFSLRSRFHKLFLCITAMANLVRCDSLSSLLFFAVPSCRRTPPRIFPPNGHSVFRHPQRHPRRCPWGNAGRDYGSVGNRSSTGHVGVLESLPADRTCLMVWSMVTWSTLPSERPILPAFTCTLPSQFGAKADVGATSVSMVHTF